MSVNDLESIMPCQKNIQAVIEYGINQQGEHPLDLMIVGENKFMVEAESALRKQRENPNQILIDKEYIEGKRNSDGRIQFEQNDEVLIQDVNMKNHYFK